MTAPAPEEQDGNLAVILTALISLLLAGAAAAGFMQLLMRLAGMNLEALRFLFRPYEELGPIVRVDAFNGDWTEPQVQQFNQNVRRRASYLINAGRRVSRAYESGGIASLRDAYERERTYWRQHRDAGIRRMRAAEAVGTAMEHYSEVLLGWHATLDDRTSVDCRMAHGRNFNPSRIPPIGYPGTVHPHCRCKPGYPFATRLRVEKIRPEHRSDAA